MTLSSPPAPETPRILEPTNFSTVGFNFLSSSQLYPEWPLGAMPSIDERTVKAVATALLALNSSHPAALAGRIATFSPPQSYHPLFQLLNDIGWMQGGKCIRSNAMYPTIVCPKGTFKISESQAAQSCDADRLNCTAGYDCVCRPCRPVPATEVDVFMLPGSLNASEAEAAAAAGDGAGAGAAPCAKLSVCAAVQQNQRVTVALRDNWAVARPSLGLAPISTVEYKYYGTALGDRAPRVAVSADPDAPDVFPITLDTPMKGFVLLEARPRFFSGSAHTSSIPSLCPAGRQCADG